MTEHRPSYAADKDAPTAPLPELKCPCDVGGHPCGSDLLGLLRGDAKSETKHIVCPFCRNAVIVSVTRQSFMEVVTANPMPERGVTL